MWRQGSQEDALSNSSMLMVILEGILSALPAAVGTRVLPLAHVCEQSKCHADVRCLPKVLLFRGNTAEYKEQKLK